MKITINYNDKTHEVKIDLMVDIDDTNLDISDAMPYIMDELYELVVKYQKSKMMR